MEEKIKNIKDFEIQNFCIEVYFFEKTICEILGKLSAFMLKILAVSYNFFSIAQSYFYTSELF